MYVVPPRGNRYGAQITTTVLMADAAHALVVGSAGAATTQLRGTVVDVDAESSGTSEMLLLPDEPLLPNVTLQFHNIGGEDVELFRVNPPSPICLLPPGGTVLVRSDGVLWSTVGPYLHEVTDLQLPIPLAAGAADGGTWTVSVSAAKDVIVTRTADAGANSWWVDVPIPSREAALSGIKPTGLLVNYSVNGATVDDVRFEIWKGAIADDGSDPAASGTPAVLFGDDNNDYDGAHNTAAERGDDTGAPEYHKAIVFDAGTPAYVDADELLRLRCYVDGDAGPSGVVVIHRAVLEYTELRVAV